MVIRASVHARSLHGKLQSHCYAYSTLTRDICKPIYQSSSGTADPAAGLAFLCPPSRHTGVVHGQHSSSRTSKRNLCVSRIVREDGRVRFASSDDKVGLAQELHQQSDDVTTPSTSSSIEELLNLNRPKTAAEKQLIWRAWMGMSDDMQAARLQLLRSLLDMLQTEEPRDAHKLRALLDAKHSLIDDRQRSFYSFWAHMILSEPELAIKYFVKLPSPLRVEYWRIFMSKIVESGHWSIGVQLWHNILYDVQWRGQSCVRELLYLIPNLHTWQFLMVLPNTAAEEMKRTISSAVIIHLAASDRPQLASAVVQDSFKYAKSLSDTAMAAQMRALSREGLHASAMELYHAVTNHAACPQALSRMCLAAINAAANLSDLTELRVLLKAGVLDNLNTESNEIRIIEPYTTAMAAFARHGMTIEVQELFDEFLTLGHKPDIVMLSALIHVRVQTLEVSKALDLFLDCERKYGIKPDQIVHNVMLHGYADTLDTHAASTLLLAMLEAGHQPDAYSASTLIDLFAHTKDADGAELVFKRMIELGVEPNVQVHGSLINAFIEAGDHERAHRAFQDFEATGLRPNTHIMNMSLKQSDQQGRSSDDMRKFVSGMSDMQVFPTHSTYTLLLKALIREGNLHAATQLFKSLKSPNEHHYTVLMVGFIRENTTESYDALFHYYNEMLERNLKPTFVTLAVLMNAFVNRGNKEFAKQAHELLDSLGSLHQIDLSSSFSPRFIPSPDVYAPLLQRNRTGSVQLIGPAKAFKMFLKSIAGTDAQPDIKTLTSIMNIYAIGSQIDRVRSIFRAIKKEADRLYRYAVSEPLVSAASSSISESITSTRSESQPARPERLPGEITQVSRGARFILAAPLQVFTKTMAKVEEFREIDRVWAALAEQGYEFDAANWNLFVQVQIGQGEIERACQLTSNNLLCDGGRIYKRTRYQFMSAFNLLKNGRRPALEPRRVEQGIEDGVGDETEEEIAEDVRHMEEAKLTWQRIVNTYGDVIRACEA